MKRILIALAAGLFAVTAAQAQWDPPPFGPAFGPRSFGPPPPQYHSAITVEQAIAAMNWLQDQQGKPHVAYITYNPAYDVYQWIGPIYDRQMTMSGYQFETEIWAAYARTFCR